MCRVKNNYNIAYLYLAQVLQDFAVEQQWYGLCLIEVVPDIKEPIFDCMGHGDTFCEIAETKRRAIPMTIKVLFIINI